MMSGLSLATVVRHLFSASIFLGALSAFGCARDAANLREPAPDGAACTVTAVVRSERSPATGATVPIEVERWWFDPSGRLLVAVEAERGTTKRRVVRSYDAQARLAEEREETLSEGATTSTSIRRIERDAAGVPVRVRSTDIGSDGARRASERAVSKIVSESRSERSEDAGSTDHDAADAPSGAAPASDEGKVATVAPAPARDYDGSGRLLRERWQTKRITGTIEETSIAFEYDPWGRLVTEQKSASRASGLFGSDAAKSSAVHYVYDGICSDAVASRVAPPRRGAPDRDEGALDRLPFRAR